MNIIKKFSPNFKKGRNGYKPEIIVIHIMDGSLIGTDAWFANPRSEVSSHYGIGYKGEVHQYVADEDTAWANGRVNNPTFKLYKDGVKPNLYTLSIEHEGNDLTRASEVQLQSSVELIRTLMTKYSIPCDRDHLIGHYQIYALKPNCPSKDKKIIDTILDRVKNSMDEIVQLPVKKSLVGKVLEFIKSLK